MAHSLTAAASIPASPIESRQTRLDAAIALFRSEASASGYVVEEVRLRLPVPDVDVMPRVVIAQQSASSGAPPPFPRAKQHRLLSSYPSPNSVPGEYPLVPEPDASFLNPTKRSYGIPGRVNTDQNGLAKSGNTGAGFKRTVSGSVIFHPVPARTTQPHRVGNAASQNSATTSQKMGPLSSIPYLPTKEGRSSLRPNGQFWKTVIGAERGKQILQAAESIQRLRHADFAHRLRKQTHAEEPVAMEISEPSKRYIDKTEEKRGQATAKSTESEELETKKEDKNIGENTHHINGHDIPESHVQLLLSSAADISVREKKPVTKAVDAPTRKTPDERKRTSTKPQETAEGKPSGGTKATPVANGKSSRGRGSDRRTSGSSAARPYKCSKCPSSFDREGHLRVHILAVHEKKRPFVCQVCDASFGHSSSLLRHVRTVHQASPAVGSGKTGNSSRNAPNSNDSGTTKSEIVCDDAEDDSEKHFRCSACRMAFSRVALLNRHVAEKHPVQTSLSDSDDN